MFKYQSISVYGFLIILSGVSLLIKSGSDIKIHALVLSLTLILSSIIAGVAALKTLTNKVQSRYHTLHAVGLLFYGIFLFFYPKTVSEFSDITALFFIFYGFSEIIFCFWLFNLEAKISIFQLVLRLALGFVFFLSSILMIGLRHPYQAAELISAGVIFIIIGTQVVLTVPIVTKLSTV
jgi:uncharacterized membrane protein HdeD (DUF308 family)